MESSALDNRQLERAVADLAGFIDAHATPPDDRFAEWTRRALEQIKAGHLDGVRLFLQQFGGMGSINDIQISSTERTQAEAQRLADEFDQLRERAWSLARRALQDQQ